jgi:ribonucleoside-diphosphate reductase alpha chain
MHRDFDEVNNELRADDAGLNIGWVFDEEYKKLVKSNPTRADEIWTKVLKTKMQTGKGYFFWKDKVNARRPKMYKDKGFYVSASNLCLEINLFSDKDHTFSCVLSTVNAYRYDEWKDTKLVQRSMIFLDAVIDDMLIKAKQDKSGMLERIIRFTENTRAVGLGVQGNTSYMQKHRMVYGGMESRQFEARLFKHLDEESMKASKYLAKTVGEPEYMKGYGERFSHRLTLPPTMSTSIIMGGYNEGCMPVFSNVFTQDTAGGNVFRINPVFLELMKERGMYTEEVMQRIVKANGSVQEEDWLTDHEKQVFLTAFELNQYTVLSMAAERQKKVDQGQSINLCIDDSTTEEEISDLHLYAEQDPNILGLYYIRSLNGLAKHKSTEECIACQG